MTTEGITSALNATERPKSPPPITHALEALLGGLSPENVSDGTADTKMVDIPGLGMLPPNSSSLSQAAVLPKDTQISEENLATVEDKKAPMPQSNEENVIGASTEPPIVPSNESTMSATDAAPSNVALLEVQNPDVQMEQPEWEEDSDPLSSDTSSSDSSDSDSDSDEEGDDSFKRLTVAEQARILMEEGGSDDESGAKKGQKEPLQTKNEKPEAILPRPDVTISAEMKVQELGEVLTIVTMGGATTVTIRAGATGEIPRLDTGSVLCSENRAVIAAISETFGPVSQPFYTMRFADPEEVTSAGLIKGSKVFFSEQHAHFVFTQDLRKLKGTDASNIHDEEVSDQEREFSDDEKEAEYKQRNKAKARERKEARDGYSRGGRGGRGGRGRGAAHNSEVRQNPSSSGLRYDDEEDDGYKVLSRPAALAAGIGPNEAPQEPAVPSFSRGRGGGQHRGNSRGGFASRGRINQESRQPPRNHQDFSRPDNVYRGDQNFTTQQPTYPQPPPYGQQFVPQPPPGWPNQYGSFVPPPPPPPQTFNPQQMPQPWPFPFPPAPAPQMNAGMYINPNFAAHPSGSSGQNNQQNSQVPPFSPPSNYPNQGYSQGRDRG